MTAPTPPPIGRDAQPHPLTFFLTVAERAAVLRALRASGPDRAASLLRALNIETKEAPRER